MHRLVRVDHGGQKMKRPVLVTVIGVAAVLNGILQLVAGVLLLILRNDESFLSDAELTTANVTSIAIACFVVAILMVVFALRLLKGSNISRMIVGVLQVASIGFGVYALVSLDSSQRASAISSIVGSLVVLYFLFGTEKAKLAAFQKRRSETGVPFVHIPSAKHWNIRYT